MAEAETKRGRTPFPETVELMGKLTKLAKRKKGVTNLEASESLGVSTMRCSVLGRRLINTGVLTSDRDERGRVTYKTAE